MNQDIQIARRYHERTTHSYWSVRTRRHTLDWQNRPLPFKIYETLAPIPLPEDPRVMRPALEAIASDGTGAAGRQTLDRATVAGLLYLSNGVTKVLRVGGEPHPFRAAACTGALYHIEPYLVCGELPDLPAGVYHYGAHDHGLRQLRAGDFRGVVLRAAADDPHGTRASGIIICTDTFWRNAWKYQARAYRHSGWDTGVILANLLAAAAGSNLAAQVVCGFADEEINRLLDVDPDKEAAVSLVALGGGAPTPPPAPPVLPLNVPTRPLSRYEADYPLIREMHQASSLSVDEVATWRGPPPGGAPPTRGAPSFPLTPTSDAALPRDSLHTVIKRRGSSRRFTGRAITMAELSVILSRSTRGVPADFLVPFGASLNDLYLIVNAVEGLPSGTYVYHRAAASLEQLQAGDFRDRAGYLALEQPLGRDAAVNIYFLAALEPILARFGNRGYRAVQLEAGILGGKVYLAAYALGLGATGLTFYDDDVVEFFSPHAAGKSTIFLTAVGHPIPPRRHSSTRTAYSRWGALL